jgi:hypothetical protein
MEVLSKHLPRETEENHQDFSQCGQCPGRDSNRASPEYKARAVPLLQSVRYFDVCGRGGVVLCGYAQMVVRIRFL